MQKPYVGDSCLAKASEKTLKELIKAWLKGVWAKQQ